MFISEADWKKLQTCLKKLTCRIATLEAAMPTSTTTTTTSP